MNRLKNYLQMNVGLRGYQNGSVYVYNIMLATVVLFWSALLFIYIHYIHPPTYIANV